MTPGLRRLIVGLGPLPPWGESLQIVIILPRVGCPPGMWVFIYYITFQALNTHLTVVLLYSFHCGKSLVLILR